MIKKDTRKLKAEFNSLIDKNPVNKDQELSEDLKIFNATFKGEDFFIENIFEGALRFFSKSWNGNPFLNNFYKECCNLYSTGLT